jgi:hypothetical protein
MPALVRLASLATLLLILTDRGAATCEQVPDLAALVADVRDVIRRENAQPARYTYLEHSRDVDISTFGKVSVGPLRTFEVYPDPFFDTWKRLIAVDGKPLDPAELQRRDAEHARDVNKAKAETPRQRAARQKRDQDEARERDAIIDDAAAVFEPGFVCRETRDGQSMIVLSLTPRQNAKVTTREGGWMKQFAGRLWISESDHAIARLRLHSVDQVSIGWGVVARVEPGSGFDYVRKRIGTAWLPSELTIEGKGRTLLFRRFEVKTVTTYTHHQPFTPPGD